MSGRVGFLAMVAVIVTARCSPSPTGPNLAPGEPHVIQPAVVDCDAAEDIRARIDDLEADGTLNHGQTIALRAKLDQAERHEAAGRPDEAAEAYARLIAQVEEWVANGVLTEEEAADLLACAEDVLDGPDTGPIIDGIKSPGEWDAAASVAVFTGGTFYYLNDDDNLYLALEVADPSLTGDDRLRIRFDNMLDGLDSDGDDELILEVSLFLDRHFEGSVPAWGVTDIQQDGTGAVGASEGINFFELAHPLNSGDPDDFSLSTGSSVGYCLDYFRDGAAGSQTTYPILDIFTTCMVTGDQSLYAVLTIDGP